MSKILVVDDEPSILLLVRLALSQAGHEVVTAPDAESAIEHCRAQCFDAVLTDVRMPGMDGHDLARWVATNHPGTATALMSGYDLKCEMCPFAPRCVLLNKPFRPKEVISTIERLLETPRA
jgi:DNA-binding NtrC family response regulator